MRVLRHGRARSHHQDHQPRSGAPESAPQDRGRSPHHVRRADQPGSPGEGRGPATPREAGHDDDNPA